MTKLKNEFGKYKNEMNELRASLEPKLTLMSHEVMDFNPNITQQIYQIAPVPKKKQEAEAVENDAQIKPTFLTKKKKDEEEEKQKKPPVILTTLEDENGKLLAYSIGVGCEGTTVYDVSHLNISRDAFVENAISLYNSTSSPSSLESTLNNQFEPCQTYNSWNDYERSCQSSYLNPFKMEPTPN